MSHYKDGYLYILSEYEEENKMLSLLRDYLIGCKSNLIKLYSSGEVYLPSAILFDKLFLELECFIKKNNKIADAISEAKQNSQRFYSRLIRLITESKHFNVDFEAEFQNKIQIFGQKVINCLKHIKNQIHIFKLQRNCTMEHENIYTSHIRYLKKNNVLKKNYIKFISQLSILSLNDYKATQKILYITIITLLTSLLIINFVLVYDKYSILGIVINVILGISLALFAIYTYPVGEFGFIDISGRNLVAYKYKVFFNYYYNNKMIKVFDMQNANHNIIQPSKL